MKKQTSNAIIATPPTAPPTTAPIGTGLELLVFVVGPVVAAVVLVLVPDILLLLVSAETELENHQGHC
jgi:hypothetical protein